MDLSGIDEKVVDKVGEEGYFTRDKAENKKGEDQFFAQGEKPEVSESYADWLKAKEIVRSLTCMSFQKKKVASARASDQKAVDHALLTTIKKEPHLMEYLGSSFSLRKGDRPHAMNF